MTHGGDGVFLWPARVRWTRRGRSERQSLLWNDFSFAPANGIEATFSRNTFIGNYVEGCEYGCGAGYSFDSRIVVIVLENRTASRSSTGKTTFASRIFYDDSTVSGCGGLDHTL